MAENEDITTESTAEELAYQQDVAMGNIILPPEEVKLDTDALAEIAKEEPVIEEPVVVEKKDDGTIPRARFNEVNEELKILRERLAVVEAAKPEPVVQEKGPSEYELLELKRDELQEQADAMFYDTELDNPAAARKPIMRQINDLNKALAKAEILYEVEQKTTQRINTDSQAQVAAKAIEVYAFLDPKSEAYDVDAVVAINARQTEFIKAGNSVAVSLQLAIDEKGPKFAKLLGLDAQVADTSKADEVRAAREKATKEKAAITILAQPGILPSKGDKSDFKVDYSKLTAQQLMALPEAEREKAMGNIV